MNEKRPKNLLVDLLFKSGGLFAGTAYLIYIIFHNELPVDIGDGVMHFGFAQDSWEHREHFLSHWAKPLFTLFSSPFAQVSYNTYLIFNVVVYFLTCVTTFGIFSRLKLALGYFFLVPLILIATPDYTACILGGMTEPFFGLLLVVALFFAFSGRWTLFAIVVSFTLFSRSEGMLIVCLGLLLIVYNRQWKAIPFLATGFIIYGFFGIPVFGTFFWYFTNDPYTATGFYGSGSWYDYILKYPQYAGHQMRYLLPVGALGWYLFYKQKDGPGKGILLFSVAIFLLILLVHSYLWFYGIKGSAGLSRLGTLGLPPFVVALLIGANRFTKEFHLLPQAFLFLVFAFYVQKKISLLPYPNQAGGNTAVILEAAEFVQENFKGRRVKYFHPLIGWKMGTRIINDPMVNVWYFDADTNKINRLGEGEIVIRDMMFGHGEAGLPRDFVKSRKEMKVVKVFENKVERHWKEGEKNDVIIYEIDRSH